MNLYKIMLEHFAPKDSEKGIFTYLIAKTDEEVYEWIAAEKKTKDERTIYNSWKCNEEDIGSFEIYNDNYDVIGEETYKERMIRLKGDINDEDAELEDLYYGKTLLGWDLVKESITPEEVLVLQSVGISLEFAA
ncbi:hypothetical protein ABEY43_07035 [Priestia megaterium]